MYPGMYPGGFIQKQVGYYLQAVNCNGYWFTQREDDLNLSSLRVIISNDGVFFFYSTALF